MSEKAQTREETSPVVLDFSEVTDLGSFKRLVARLAGEGCCAAVDPEVQKVTVTSLPTDQEFIVGGLHPWEAVSSLVQELDEMGVKIETA